MDSLGPYRELDEIGGGGQATVYRGVHPGLERTVAIKVLHPHLSSDQAYVARFLREARVAASIDHPNVARVYDVAQDGAFHYIALEYLPGDLRALIDKEGSLDADRAAALGAQIAAGLAAAHRLGIIHRDVKPHNILLADDGTPKVTDFGLARAADGTALTQSGALMGTPFYMSPEQAEGKRADARSDVYSLGVVLYQMLTGEVPYSAESPMAVIRMHLDFPIPDVRAVAPSVPLALAEIVARCMAKAPEYRYQNAGEVLEALNRWRSERTPSDGGPALADDPADAATVVGRGAGPGAAVLEAQVAKSERRIEAQRVAAEAGLTVGPAAEGVDERTEAAMAARPALTGAAPPGTGRRLAGLLLGLLTAGLLAGAFGMFSDGANPPASGVFMLGSAAFMALASYLALSRRGNRGRARARSVLWMFVAGLALLFVSAAIGSAGDGRSRGPGAAGVVSGGGKVVAPVEPAASGQGFVARVADAGGPDAPVSRVLFARGAGLEGATVVARALGSPAEGGAPGLLSRPVNRYIAMSVESARNPSSIKAVVEFGVERLWLRRNGLAPSAVRLYRFHDGWSTLTTQVLDAGGDVVTYAAVTPGFSVFAIGAAGAVAGESPTPAPTAAPAPTPRPTATAVRLPMPAPRPTPTPVPPVCTVLETSTAWAGSLSSDDGSLAGDIEAVFEQSDCKLGGKLAIGAPLHASGPLEGRVDGDSVKFVLSGATSGLPVDVLFRGELRNGELVGRYEAVGGGEAGDWRLAPRGAGEPPEPPEDEEGPLVLGLTVSPVTAAFGDVVTVEVEAEDPSGIDHAFVSFTSPDGQTTRFFCEFPGLPVTGTCTASATAGEDSELLSAGPYIFQQVAASDARGNESLYHEDGSVDGAGEAVSSHSLGAPGFFIRKPEPPTPTPTPFRRPIPTPVPRPLPTPTPTPTPTPRPVIYLLAWLNAAGLEVSSVVEGTTVTLHAEGKGLDGQSLPVQVFEVDPVSPDDLVASGEMGFARGVGTAQWNAVWTADGLFGAGGDPEYKFVVLGRDSPELVVTRQSPPTPTPRPTATPTPLPTPTPTPTPTPAATPTPLPLPTPTPTPTRVPSVLTLETGNTIAGPAATTVSLSGARVTSTSIGDTFAAVIDWRDGSEPEAALVLQYNGQIIASHTYAEAGTYFVRVTVENQHNDSASGTVTAVIGAAIEYRERAVTWSGGSTIGSSQVEVITPAQGAPIVDTDGNGSLIDEIELLGVDASKVTVATVFAGTSSTAGSLTLVRASAGTISDLTLRWPTLGSGG